METRPQKNLVLILAREFASKLATPMFLADADGNLVFYNEPAEDILGRTFAEAGEMPADEWPALFETEDVEGNPISLTQMPAGVAFAERRPAHGTLRIKGLDGVRRTISVTGFPLFAHTAEFVGVVAIFWQADEGA
ncbi:MAG: PAS domain-containing protein [Actinomycetota bacterium]|nr:PAS domain-containing protein [Actinomycetota bacterium]